MYDTVVLTETRRAFLPVSLPGKFALLLPAAVMLYVLVGFLLAPRLLKDNIAATLATIAGRRVVVAGVTVNPLKLKVELSGVAFQEAGQVPVLELDHAEFQLDLLSLVRELEWRGHVRATGTTRGSGQIHATGWLSPLQPLLDAEITFTGVDLTAFSQLLILDDSLELTSGLVDATGSAHFQGRGLTLNGELEAANVVIIDRSRAERLLEAETIEGIGIDIDTVTGDASVARVRLVRPGLWLTRDRSGLRRPAHTILSFMTGPGPDDYPAQDIDVQNGRLHFADLSLALPVSVSITNVNGRIGHARTSDGNVAGTLHGQLSGIGDVAVTWQGTNAGSTVDATLNNVDARLLSPYLAALISHDIIAGQLDAHIGYREQAGAYAVEDEFSLTGLQLAEMSKSAGPAHYALNFALALLEDDRAHISASIPIPNGRLDGDEEPLAHFRAALTAFVDDLTGSAFRILAEAVGQPERDLAQVTFERGSAALSPTATENLEALAQALLSRPRLNLLVNGRYDPVTDRAVLAHQQMRLHIALATSAGPPGAATRAPLDVTNPRVVDILNEFSTTRLPAKELTAIRARFPEGGKPFYQAEFDALVANEPVSDTAMTALARYRAQSILNQLTAAGVAAERLEIGPETAADQGSTDAVAVALTLAAPARAAGSTAVSP